jgi:tRNA(fMet)-specific endonuclease VapC
VARLILDTDVLAVTPVCDYDRTVAEHHAALLAYVRQSGEPRGATTY